MEHSSTDQKADPLLRGVMVSYLNTLPYVHGLRSVFTGTELDLIQAVPAQTVQLYKELQLDVALVPVAALSGLPEVFIPEDAYGIASTGAVGSVCLYAHVALDKIQSIVLDEESKTSNQLLRVLCREYWNLEPKFITASQTTEGEQAPDAVLAIGDKTFVYHEQFPYRYDLGLAWHEWCGLPFVFAIWVFRKKPVPALALRWAQAMERSVQDVPQVLQTLPVRLHEQLSTKDYFMRYLQFKLNRDHLLGMKKFMDLIR